MKQRMEGVITPMITPLIDREKLDVNGLYKMLDRLADGGVAGIFLMGTTGEGASLSYRLRRELIDLTVKYVAGRTKVLVSITDTCIEEALAMADHAAAAGADYLVSALPYYLGLTQDEMVDWYTVLADHVSLPLFLYNIPAQTKLMMSVATVKKLAAHPNIIGIKDSSGNGTYFNTLLAEVKSAFPDFNIFVGPDEMLASTMALGGNGGVNSGSNLFPELYVSLFNACKERDSVRMAELQRLVMKVSTDIYGVDTSQVAFLKGLKAALYLEGIITDRMCDPLRRVSDADLDIIRGNLSGLKQQIAQVL